MNKHYANYLKKKYSPLYTAIDTYGFCVGDGWFDIINHLSEILCADWLAAQHEYNRLKANVGKGKYGSAVPDEKDPAITEADVMGAQQRMDEKYHAVPIAAQIKEKFGGLRFYVDNATTEQYSFIEMAEFMSMNTCEMCGGRGKIGGRFWLKCLCKTHRKEKDEKEQTH